MSEAREATLLGNKGRCCFPLVLLACPNSARAAWLTKVFLPTGVNPCGELFRYLGVNPCGALFRRTSVGWSRVRTRSRALTPACPHYSPCGSCGVHTRLHCVLYGARVLKAALHCALCALCGSLPRASCCSEIAICPIISFAGKLPGTKFHIIFGFIGSADHNHAASTIARSRPCVYACCSRGCSCDAVSFGRRKVRLSPRRRHLV